MNLFRHSSLFLLLCVLGCTGQAPSLGLASNNGPLPPETTRRVENSVRSMLGERIPPTVTITVKEIKSSDIGGYETVVVTLSKGAQTQDLELLISKDRKTLLRADRFDVGTFPEEKMTLKGRPVRGNKNAKVTIVNFDDFQCPYCARMHQTLATDILRIYGDKVRIIYKDYPLSIHPWAIHAAVDANCLNDQNNDAYWGFADTVHLGQGTINNYPDQKDKRRPLVEQLQLLDKMAAEQGAKFKLDGAKLDACVKAQNDEGVRASMKEAEKVDVESTPTLFVNGERFSGAYPLEMMRPILDRALRSVGVEPPSEEPKPAAADVKPAESKPADAKKSDAAKPATKVEAAPKK